jgi:hypothetical protein
MHSFCLAEGVPVSGGGGFHSQQKKDFRLIPNPNPNSNGTQKKIDVIFVIQGTKLITVAVYVFYSKFE